MTQLLAVGQRLLKTFSNRSVYARHRKWMNLMFKPSMQNKLSYHCLVYMESKNILDKNHGLCLHQHISSGVSPDPVQQEFDRIARFLTMLERNFGKTLADFIETLSSDEAQNLVMTESEWEMLLDSVEKEGKAPGLDCDAIIMEYISKEHLPELAISLMEYIKKKKVPALSVFTALISVCGEKYPDIVYREHEELLKHYTVLDVDNCKKLIKGFSKTSNWKKCLEFVEQARLSGESKQVHVPGMESIIEAAVAHNDMSAFESLVSSAKKDTQFILLPQSFSSAIYNAWKNGSIDAETFLKILSVKKGYLRRNEAKYFAEELARNRGDSFKSHWGTIRKGRCGVCGQVLTGQSVTDSQINTLEQRLQTYITSSKFIYMYSRPEEYEYFCDWHNKNGPFDVVVDVANMLTTKRPLKFGMVKEIAKINKFLEPYERVLYVTRSQGFSRAIEKFLDNRHLLYMPNTKSDDDVFIVHAALKSGSRGHILTGDNLKDLKANMGSDVTLLFEHWQRHRQLFLQVSKKLLRDLEQSVWMPQEYDFCVQEHDSGWHIPYTQNEGEKKHNIGQPAYIMPETILCLHKT